LGEINRSHHCQHTCSSRNSPKQCPKTHATKFHSIKHASEAHKHGTNQQDTQQQNERLNLAPLTFSRHEKRAATPGNATWHNSSTDHKGELKWKPQDPKRE